MSAEDKLLAAIRTALWGAAESERERCARLVEDQAEFISGTAFEKLCHTLAAKIRSAPTTAGQEPPLTQAQLDEQAKLWDGGSELIRGGPAAGQE